MHKALKVVRPTEVAKILSISLSTLDRWSKHPNFPKKFSLSGGRAVGFDYHEVLEFIEARKQERVTNE